MGCVLLAGTAGVWGAWRGLEGNPQVAPGGPGSSGGHLSDSLLALLLARRVAAVCVVLCVLRELLSWVLPHGGRDRPRPCLPSWVPLPIRCSDPGTTACLWGHLPTGPLSLGFCVTLPPPHHPALVSAGVGYGAQLGHLGVSHGCPYIRDPEGWPLPTPGRAILGPWVSMGITSVLG